MALALCPWTSSSSSILLDSTAVYRSWTTCARFTYRLRLFEENMSADYAMAIVATHCSSLKVAQQANTTPSGTTARFVKPAQPPQDAIHALVLLRTRRDGNVRHDTTFQASSFNCQRCQLPGLEHGHLCLLPPCHHCCFARFPRLRYLGHEPYHQNLSGRDLYLPMSLAISLRSSTHHYSRAALVGRSY
jgi:hypothetical protein